jgi:hypothetical protein
MNLKIVIASFLFLSFNSLNAQNNVYPEKLSPEPPRILYQKDIYQDSSSLIVFQQVIRTDSIGKTELKKRFKNWGGKAYINFSEVLVSETDDQMVLVYIVDCPGKDGIGKWYVRMIANFKDDRVRISLYDDGNVFIPASQYSNGLSARASNVTVYFKRYGKIDPNKSNFLRKWHDGVIEWRNKILSTLVSCGEGLTQPTSANDDW